MELISPAWHRPETCTSIHPPPFQPSFQIKVVDLDHGELVEDEPYGEPGGDDADPEAFSNLDSALPPFAPQVSVHYWVPEFSR